MQATQTLDSSNLPSGDEFVRPGCMARLLYALLDAADDDGLMRNWAHRGEWRSARNEAEQSGYIPVLPLLIELMAELDGEGRLDRSWIHRRWNDVKTKLSRT